MKALVVNPWIYDFTTYDLWSKPLGPLKIIAFLEKNNFNIEFIDCLDRFHPALDNIQKKSKYATPYGDGHYISEEIDKPIVFKDIPRKYKRYGMPVDIFSEIASRIKDVDIIFIGSGLTYWYPGSFLAIEMLKKRFKGAPIVLGGVYATLCYEHAKRLSGADVVFRGDDTKELADIIGGLLGIDLRIKKIDDLDLYFTTYPRYSTLKYATILTSRGCCFKCSYCGWHLLNKKFIQYPAERVVDAIF